MTKSIPRLKTKYETEVVPSLMQDLKIKNRYAVPKIVKVVVNMGVGSSTKDENALTQAMNDLSFITGQKPVVRKARISVASFGVRKGTPVGLKVTLRRDRMYAFLDKLFSIVLPRLRDFRGLSLQSFDKEGGNYTLGIEDHSVFPEVDIAKSSAKGLEITIVTNAKDNKRAIKLLESLGMPFRK